MSEPKRMSDAELASALAEFAVLANHYAKQHAHLPLAISRHIDAINIELTRRALTAEPSRVEDTIHDDDIAAVRESWERCLRSPGPG